jgi:sialidase-1
VRLYGATIATALLASSCQGGGDGSGTLGSKSQRTTSSGASTRALLPTIPQPYVNGPFKGSEVDCLTLPSCNGTDDIDCCNSSTRERTIASPIVAQQVVFQPAATGPKGFQIPALLQIPDGPLLAFAEARYNDEICDGKVNIDKGRVEIVVKIRPKGSHEWSSSKLICAYNPDGDANGDTCGNPTPAYDAINEQVYVLMTAKPRSKPPGDTGPCPDPPGRFKKVFYVSSGSAQDDPKDWDAIGDVQFSAPQDISAKVQSGMDDSQCNRDCTGPGNGIQLSTGELVFPACSVRNIVLTPEADPADRWSTRFLFVADNVPLGGSTEGTVVETTDHRLMRNDRSTNSGLNDDYRRRMSRGPAVGPGWTPFATGGQPLNPSHQPPDREEADYTCGYYAPTCPGGYVDACQASVRRFSQGAEVDRLVFSGPASSARRRGLTIRISYDEGTSWPVGRELLPVTVGTGYSSIERVGNRIGALFETSNGGHMLRYAELDVGAVLCGRPEPIFVGGNAWLGTYQREIVRSDKHQYWTTTTLGGQQVSVFVEVPVSDAAGVLLPQTTLTRSLQLRIGDNGAWQAAAFTRSNPGIFTLIDGTTGDLRGAPSETAWCNKGYKMTW